MYLYIYNASNGKGNDSLLQGGCSVRSKVWFTHVYEPLWPFQKHYMQCDQLEVLHGAPDPWNHLKPTASLPHLLLLPFNRLQWRGYMDVCVCCNICLSDHNPNTRMKVYVKTDDERRESLSHQKKTLPVPLDGAMERRTKTNPLSRRCFQRFWKVSPTSWQCASWVVIRDIGGFACVEAREINKLGQSV